MAATRSAGTGFAADRVAAIILAAGSSTRMSHDKLWADLGGVPLVARAIQVFASSSCIDELVVVVRAGQETPMRELVARLGVAANVVVGGAERQDSVRAGLDATEDAEWVLIHDAARPLVTPDLVERGLDEARKTGAAIAAVPAVDTIKVVEEGCIVGTPDRGTLWHAQTPQVFRRSVLLAAHEAAGATTTDDAALVEAAGVPVRVFPGAYSNLKVTTDGDLIVARALAARADHV
jgi:2-C-methyl-D-erythritol 4-phosphate cytidylyltransferase